MSSQSPMIFWASASLAFVADVASSCFLAVLAVAFATENDPISAVTITALVAEVLSLLLLCVVLCRQSMASPHGGARRRNRVENFLGVALALVAAGSTIATLIWMGINLSGLQPIIGIRPLDLMICTITTLTVSSFSQIVVYAIIFLDRHDLSVPIVLRSVSQPRTLHEGRTNRSGLPGGIEKSGVGRKGSPSFRSSFSTTVRSATSKTVLIPSRPGSANNTLMPSRPSSVVDMSSPSTDRSHFDSWDTSNVPPPLREVAHSRHPPPIGLAILPPIPGSRPASPTKPLDESLVSSGKAGDGTSPALSTLPERAILPPSPHSPQSSRVKRFSPPPPPIPPMSPKRTARLSKSRPTSNPPFATQARTAPSTPTSQTPSTSQSFEPLPMRRSYSTNTLADSISHLPSRSPSASKPNPRNRISEEFIHPLFRSSNASPPPGVSGGTVVMAASIEEVVEGFERGLGRMSVQRNGPAPVPSGVNKQLNGIYGISTTGDIKEASKHDSGYAIEHDSSAPVDSPTDSTENASDSIPDFILAAGSSGSFVGFEKRRSTMSSRNGDVS